MRCKKHPADVSSAVGICASCLRHRLFTIMEAQAEAQRECPPPLKFPRSVSPHIYRRKTDTAAVEWNHHSIYRSPQPQIKKTRCNGGGRFSALFFGLFRSKSGKHDLDSSPVTVSDPGVSIESCSASPSWFSNIIPQRRKKQIRSLSVDENSIGAQRKGFRNRERGMSPAGYSDEEDDEQFRGGSSGYSSESSQGWKQTPRRTPATVRWAGPARGIGLSRNVSELAFCLSPLVRASPNRHWNQKGVAPESVMGGESRVPAKPELFARASFCKNRSRKLADFGRYNSRH